MNTFKSIRVGLGVTQSAIAEAIGVTQGNVSFYEKGQTVPPTVAAKLIDFAASRGHRISFDDIYANELITAEHPAPAEVRSAA